MKSIPMSVKGIAVVVSVFLCLFIAPVGAQAAAGDITAVRIEPHSFHTDGWMAEIDIEGYVTGGTADYGLGDDGNSNTVDNDPADANVVFTVTSQGFNASGAFGTITRTVYGTKSIRKPYPDQDTMDETASGGTLTVNVALSEFIYDDDTVTVTIPAGWYTDDGAGGSSGTSNAVTNMSVTNNSSVNYPRPIGRWAWPGYERLTADFLVEAVVFHRFAQNGKPLAVVAFSASDQSGNTVWATTTTMTISARSGDANPVLVYAATMDIDALDQGEVIDVNFRAYPWVGNQSSILDSRVGLGGYTQPDERLGPLHFLNDKSGTYGTGYAYVNSSTGNDSTGTVYSTQSAAESGSAYLTIRGAATGIKTYHNTNHGRNDAGGGIVLLAEGQYPFAGGTQPNPDLGTTMDAWLIVKPATGAAKANTKISSGGATIRSAKLKLEGITVEPSVSSGGGLTGRSTDILWLHDNIINGTSSTPFFAWRTAYATQNTVTALTRGFNAQFSSSRGPFAIIRGNDSTPTVEGHFYSVLGNNNIEPLSLEESSQAVVSAGMATSTNAIFAFNSVYNLETDMVIVDTSTSTGIALVQNLFERIGDYPAGIMSMSAANGIGATTTNFILWHNTFVGERIQFGYNSAGTVAMPKMNWGIKFNIFSREGIKSDTFTGTDGGHANRVGNWPLVYAVGNVGNKTLKADFAGDFEGLFGQRGPTASFLTLGYVDDNSKETGSDTGNGDYQLLSTSIAIDPATTTSDFHQLIPYDLLGNSRYGSPDSGAYEYQPPYTMGTHAVATSSTIRMYGDEKWRPKTATTTSGTADLVITIPGSDTSQWLDISVSLWNAAGTYQKTWTETSSTTALTDVAHTVDDLAANNYYTVSVDGVAGDDITGDDCTTGVCLSNSSGEITFTYTGTYSSHTFDVSDETAPTITNISSDTANETYDVGQVIDIDVTFSEAVTSSGNVTVTLETGATDRTCTFTVSDTTTGTCDYTVQDGDTSSDLTVSSISGTIEDSAGNAMTNFVPVTNLAANKAIVISTVEEVSESSPAASPTSGSGGRVPSYVPPQTVISTNLPVVAGCPTGYICTPMQTSPTVSAASAAGTSFSRSLSLGSIGDDVRRLQTVLNNLGFVVSATGYGSSGKETSYFGSLTRAAVVRFQEAYVADVLAPFGLNRGTGYFGLYSIRKMNTILAR